MALEVPLVSAEGYNLSEDDWTKEIAQEQFQYQSFVKEFPQLKQKLQDLTTDPRTSFNEISQMLLKYQEQPELLDPHLQEIVDLIMTPIKNHLDQRSPQIMNDPNFIVNCGFELIYTLVNVRGYKTVVRYMPHDVVDLEPCLDFLMAMDAKDRSLWCTRYCLFLWLSIIVLIPFDLQIVDSQGGMISKIIQLVQEFLKRPGKSRDGASVLIAKVFSRPDFQQSHMTQFFDWCKHVLTTQAEDENIFLFVGVFQSLAEIFKHAHRDLLYPHAESTLVSVEKVWSVSKSRVLKKYTAKLATRIGLVFLKPVVAGWRYQKGRHVLLPDDVSISHSHSDEKENPESDVTMDERSEEKSGSDAESSVTVTVTLSTDQSSSVTASEEKQINAESDDFSVPKQIDIILDHLLKALRDRETVVRWSAAKGVGRIMMRLPRILGDQVVTNVLELLSPTEDADSWHGGCLCLAELARRGLLLPKRLADVVERVEKAMLYDKFQGTHSTGDHVRDASCYVAWAFARAYEPSVMQSYVSKLARSLLVMATFDREIHCRRAACAAFQENVGRQGNFPHGIDINTTADYWTVGLIQNAYLSVSKSIAQFDEYKHWMMDHLVTAKLSHWDLKLRKLAGDSIYNLTELDPTYVRDTVLPILIHRCQSQSIFERHGGLYGTSKIVQRLFELKIEISDALQKPIRNIIPKLEKIRGYRGRGGEHVREAACKVICAIASSHYPLSDAAIDRYQQSIDENLRIPQDFVQNAALDALRALSKSYYVKENEKRNKNITLKWCEELRTELVASVTRGYARGLGALTKPLVLPHLKNVVDSLITKSMITENPDTRDYLTRQMCVISLADLVENIGVEDYPYAWTETDDEKKDDDEDELALLGIEDVTAQKHERNPNALVITDEQFAFQFDRSSDDSCCLLYDRILSAILVRFEDYEVDRRGDIGSFVREHALMTAARVVLALQDATLQSKTGYKWLRPSMIEAFIRAVLRQSSEKLDRVRRAAGAVIELLFCSDNAVAQSIEYPHNDIIRSLFADKQDMDWSSPGTVFPIVVQLLPHASYRRTIFEGLLQSIGCISSNMSQTALDAVKPHLLHLQQSAEKDSNSDSARQLNALGRDMIDCCAKRYHNPLFILPFYKSIGILLTTGDYFSPLKTKQNKFAKDLQMQCKRECYKSADIMKLMASVQVFIGLALFPSTRESALQRLLIFLGYQYPALRRETADRLYGALQTWEELGGDQTDPISDFLIENTWSGQLEDIREVRNQLFPLFGVRSPKLKKPAK